MCTNAHIARLQAVALAKETTSWTLSAWTKFRIPKESGVMKPIIESVTDTSGYWVIETNYDSQVSRETSQLNLKWIVDYTNIWLLLKATFWSETSTAKSAPNATVYDHLFTVLNSNNHPSLSAWWYDPVGTFTSTFNMVQSLKLTASMSEYVKFEVNLVGKKMTTASTPTVWYTSWNHQFLWRHVLLYTADTEVGLDSATAIKLNSFELNIEKNIEMTWIWLEPDCFVNQNFVVSGNLEALFTDNTTWLDLVRWANEKFFRIKILNTDATIWSTANPALEFTFAKAVFNEWDKSDDNDSIVTQTVWFIWHFNNTAGYSVKSKLTNLQTAVY